MRQTFVEWRVKSKTDCPQLPMLDAVRQRVVIHMAFDMGVTGLLAMIRFVAAVEFHFWETAAQEMSISQWAKEGKRRAAALVEMMRTGHDDQIGGAHPRTAELRGQVGWRRR